MKKTLCIALSSLLLLTACGSPADATPETDSSSAASASASAPFEPAKTAEEYAVEIASLFIDVTGTHPVTSVSRTYELSMPEGTVTDIQDTYIIAEGVMQNTYHATEAPVTVKFYLDENGYPMSGVVVSEDEVVFTPAVPYSMDLWYETAKPVKILPLDADDYITLTRETFPGIELLDEWTDNYRYRGNYVLTDSEGNKWMPRPDDLSFYSFGYRAVQYSNGDKYQWEFPDCIVIVPYEE